jgi:hypothetical protein
MYVLPQNAVVEWGALYILEVPGAMSALKIPILTQVSSDFKQDSNSASHWAITNDLYSLSVSLFMNLLIIRCYVTIITYSTVKQTINKQVGNVLTT